MFLLGKQKHTVAVRVCCASGSVPLTQLCVCFIAKSKTVLRKFYLCSVSCSSILFVCAIDAIRI